MEISPKELNDKLQNQNALLLDVRTPAEFMTCHVKGAINVPLDSLEKSEIERLCQGKTEVLTICQSGKRGATAQGKLSSWGIQNVSNVSGGTLACKSSGLAVNEGDIKVISLDRQVRIAAGSFVLLGLILAQIFSASWLCLSAFVGAGLIFSGVTDTCGMGVILAKMPWNRNVSCNTRCNL